MSENKIKKPSRNFFVFYCIVLFLFAAILVTFSYLSQERVEQQLVDTTEKAKGFESGLEKANVKIEELETTVVEQKKQIEELTKKADEADVSLKKSTAADSLWKLVKASYQKKYNECRKIIASIDADGLRQYLSEEGLKELERIEKNTKGV